MDTASARWAKALGAWAIPEEILTRAPESPWGFPTALFGPADEPAVTPSRRRALEALPPGGSVLDVGVGTGAASLALVPPAGEVVGVDASSSMLARFREEASLHQVPARAVHGSWPEVAAAVPEVDVVVCHHVLYNVADLVPFVRALSSHARRRVVVELTDEHPQAGLNELWLHFHGLERPTGPTVEDAVEVLTDIGIRPAMEHFTGPARFAGVERQEVVAFARRRLCLPADRDAEVDRLLPSGSGNLGRRLTCLWWGDAPA